jgi:glycosidase
MFANRFHPGKFEFTDRHASSPEAARRKDVVTSLNALRRECGTLSDGTTEWLITESEKVLAFKRVSENGEILFIGNFSSKAEDLKLDLESKEILLSNKCEINENALSLAGYGYAIINVSSEHTAL